MNSNQQTETALSARELILALTDSSRENTLQAGYFIAAGELFAMDSGTIRVALARLVKDASLMSAGRGCYQRRNRAGELHSMVRSWAEVERGLRLWNGDWLSAATAHLGRTNSSRVRSRERALRLLGFAELRPGSWIRPANLIAPLEQIRDRLLQLGLEPEAMLMNFTEITPQQILNPTLLWPTSDLEARYQQNLDLLAASETRLQGLEQQERARETLLIGRKVTRDILLDPLLPSELVDTSLRRQMIEAMKTYDRTGKSIWRDFYNQHHAQQPSGRGQG